MQKKRNARVTRATLNTFIPVPPNTSLAKITENAVATARIHKRTIYRNNHRNQDTGNEETFLDFFFLPLGHNELNAQTYYIRNDDFRQYSQKTVANISMKLPVAPVFVKC